MFLGVSLIQGRTAYGTCRLLGKFFQRTGNPFHVRERRTDLPVHVGHLIGVRAFGKLLGQFGNLGVRRLDILPGLLVLGIHLLWLYAFLGDRHLVHVRRQPCEDVQMRLVFDFAESVEDDLAFLKAQALQLGFLQPVFRLGHGLSLLDVLLHQPEDVYVEYVFNQCPFLSYGHRQERLVVGHPHGDDILEEPVVDSENLVDLVLIQLL